MKKILFLVIALFGLIGCATVFPPEIDYSSTRLLYSDNLQAEPDIYNGQAVFSAYLSGNPASQKTIGKRYRTSIFLANADGSSQRRLTFGICEESPFWTKDGDIVYFGGDDCINRKWILLDMEDGKVVDKTEISERIANALKDKTMTGEDAQKIKWR